MRWGIVTSEDERRASYYFQGPAIDGSAEAEHAANAGDIIISAELHDLVSSEVHAETLPDLSARASGLKGRCHHSPGRSPGKTDPYQFKP